MKKTRFNFFLQHFEKIVLGVSALFLLAVGAIYWAGLLGPAITVPAPSGQVPISEIRERVDSEARRLQTSLNSTEPKIPQRQVPDWPTAHAAKYAAPVTQGPMLSRIDTPGLTETSLNPPEIQRPSLYLPTPPVAGTYIIKADHAVLADARQVAEAEDRQRVEAIQQMVGNDQPNDFQYVWVAVDFPLREWGQRLAADDRPRDQRIPQNVWQTRFGLAGVYLLREEQDPLTGQWGSPTLVQPLPGQLAYTATTILPDLNPEDASARVQTLLSSQATVAQPPFPPTAHSDPLPPNESDRALSPEEQELRRKLQREIQVLERRLQALTGQEANPRPRSFEGDMGVDEFGGGRPRPAPRQNTTAAQRQAEQRQRQVDGVTEELAAKRAELNNLLGIQEDTSASQFLGGGAAAMGGEFIMDEFGGMMDSSMMSGPNVRQPGGRPAPGGFPAPGQQQPGQDFVNTLPERVRVWAQDLTVQPGRTYRYKVVVSVINPLFQYTRVAAEQREVNEFKLALGPSQEELDSAEWSPPVHVEQEQYFFLVEANAADQINPARVRVEVWRVFDGMWRKQQFVENPGNPIGGVETFPTQLLGPQPVDMHVGAVVLDIDIDASAGARSNTRMLYYDEQAGDVRFRLRNDDRDDPKRAELTEREKAQAESQVAAR